MRCLMQTVRVTALACLALLLPGCEGFVEYFKEPPTVGWITSIDKVAGQWEGQARQVLPSSRDDGRLVLVIQGNGAYKLTLDGAADSAGSGTLVIRSGRLVAEAKDRNALVTLLERGKDRALGIDVTKKTGERYYAELQRVALAR